MDSILYLLGDSTNCNTGWKGGTHAHLEKLLERRLVWGICNIHTHELPLRHLIAALNGPGEVCSLLSKVNEMPYDPNFKVLPGGEDLIYIPEDVAKNMGSLQNKCYKLVEGVKSGSLPEELQEIKCVELSHSRWL